MIDSPSVLYTVRTTAPQIADLKKELKERGLPISGNKSELAARLRDALAAEGTADGSPQEDDLEAKESELLGEEDEEEEEDTASVRTGRAGSGAGLQW